MKKDTFDFESPFEVDTLLEVRTSGMKNMPGLKVLSGIDKQVCPRPMKLTKLGLQGDEHDMTFHGGPDKAILGCRLIKRHVFLFWLIMFFRKLTVNAQTARRITPTGPKATLSAQTGSCREDLERTL